MVWFVNLKNSSKEALESPYWTYGKAKIFAIHLWSLDSQVWIHLFSFSSQFCHKMLLLKISDISNHARFHRGVWIYINCLLYAVGKTFLLQYITKQDNVLNSQVSCNVINFLIYIFFLTCLYPNTCTFIYNCFFTKTSLNLKILLYIDLELCISI